MLETDEQNTEHTENANTNMGKCDDYYYKSGETVRLGDLTVSVRAPDFSDTPVIGAYTCRLAVD